MLPVRHSSRGVGEGSTVAAPTHGGAAGALAPAEEGEREMEDILYPEEVAYLEDEWLRDRRCVRCDHLLVFHHYNGGLDCCVICGCE